MRAELADLYMLNGVLGDTTASVDFYRHPGIVGPQGEETTGTAQVAPMMPGGFSLELATLESARMCQVAWRANPENIGISLPSREAIGEHYRQLTAAVALANDDQWEDP
jgi:hypothetical protein